MNTSILEKLSSLPEPALFEFMKWLAFSHGRSIGIRVDLRNTSSNPCNRVRSLAETLALAVKQPEDAKIGLRFPPLHFYTDDVALVAAIAEYLVARDIAMHQRPTVADFEPHYVYENQERALSRIIQRIEGAKQRKKGSESAPLDA